MEKELEAERIKMTLEQITDGAISEEDRKVVNRYADCREEGGIKVGYCEDYGETRCLYTCHYAHGRRTFSGRFKHFFGVRFIV